MFSQKEIKIILVCFLFLLSCAGPGLEISKKEVPVDIASNNDSRLSGNLNQDLLPREMTVSF